jgi:hypothetical protein
MLKNYFRKVTTSYLLNGPEFTGSSNQARKEQEMKKEEEKAGLS